MGKFEKNGNSSLNLDHTVKLDIFNIIILMMVHDGFHDFYNDKSKEAFLDLFKKNDVKNNPGSGTKGGGQKTMSGGAWEAQQSQFPGSGSLYQNYTNYPHPHPYPHPYPYPYPYPHHPHGTFLNEGEPIQALPSNELLHDSDLSDLPMYSNYGPINRATFL